MNHLISIIVPVYNGEQYLKELLDSIKKQKYKKYEVLLINDGSTDNSESICLKYKSKDKRIKYYYKNNTGVSETRNFGIGKAKGEYICFVDADDIISPSYLSDFIELSYRTESDLYCCDLRKMVNPVCLEINKKFQESRFEKINKYEIINSSTSGYMCNKMFKTDIIKKNNLKFKKDIYMCEDFLFIFEYLNFCNNVTCINKSNYIYRIIPTSASKNIGNIKWFSILKVYDIILQNKKVYTNSFFNKMYYSYVLYLYQAKYRLNYIKKESNYYYLKSDIYTRISKISKDKTIFTIKQRTKLFFYRYLNKVSFYLKLKKDLMIKRED